MLDLLAALGLVLAFEGLCFAAFPSAVRKAALEISQAPIDMMRIVGVVSAAVGVGLIWLVRADIW